MKYTKESLQECIEIFTEELGEPLNDDNYQFDPNDLDQKLPEALNDFLNNCGTASFSKGLIQFVNPLEYDGLVADWVKNTVIQDKDIFHLFLKNALGNMYLIGENTGVIVTISSLFNYCMASLEDFNKKISSQIDNNSGFLTFLTGSDIERFDIEYENGNSIFSSAYEKLGMLKHDEIYGFEPMLIAGGEMKVENIQKVKFEQHISIMRSFVEPSFPSWKMEI